MLYSLDTPVKAEQIKAAADHNDGILVEQGKELRSQGAVSAFDFMTQNAQREQVPMPNGVELSVQEDGDSSGSLFSEGYRVAAAPAPTKRRRRG